MASRVPRPPVTSHFVHWMFRSSTEYRHVAREIRAMEGLNVAASSQLTLVVVEDTLDVGHELSIPVVPAAGVRTWLVENAEAPHRNPRCRVGARRPTARVPRLVASADVPHQ